MAKFSASSSLSSGCSNEQLQKDLTSAKPSLPLFLFLCWFPRQRRDSLFRILGSRERDLRPWRSTNRPSFQSFTCTSLQLLLLLEHPAGQASKQKRVGATSRKVVTDLTKCICLGSVKSRRFQIRMWHFPSQENRDVNLVPTESDNENKSSV